MCAVASQFIQIGSCSNPFLHAQPYTNDHDQEEDSRDWLIGRLPNSCFAVEQALPGDVQVRPAWGSRAERLLWMTLAGGNEQVLSGHCGRSLPCPGSLARSAETADLKPNPEMFVVSLAI
jgi:hypothetical protein